VWVSERERVALALCHPHKGSRTWGMAARGHGGTGALGMWRRVKHAWQLTVVELMMSRRVNHVS
jgi:hypothetical protein